MHAELRAIREERDRLRCELIDSHAEVVITGVAPLSDSSTSQNGGRRSSRHLRGSQSAGSGPFSTASDARSAASDSRRAARPTQGIQPSLFELKASTRTGADGRSNPVGSTNSSPRERGGSRTTNAAYIHGPPLHHSTTAAAGPHGRPSSTGDLPILGAHLVRDSARFHTGPGYGLRSTSADDSLSGLAVDWLMSLKAEDIPTWEDLSRKFTDKYRYCAETPPTLLELSTKEMAHGQRGVYYSHLLAHTSSFSDLIEAGKKLDLGIKLGRMEGPVSKGEESSKKANPLPDHGPAQRPSINMITVCTSREGEGEQGWPSPFVIEYVPAEAAVRFTGIEAPPAPLVIDIPTREPYSDDKVPWTYEGGVGNLEQQFGVMGITRSGRLYENPTTTDKGKAPAIEVEEMPRALSTPPKKVTEEEAEALMKIIKASEYKVVEQMAKSPAHISLLALLLNSQPHREALLRVLTAAQVPKGTTPDRIEETINSIFSNTISFSDDELPSEGCVHSRALHIVCKCNNHIVGRVMIDNGSALNVCPVTTLKQMNVDLNRIRPNKTAVRAFDGSQREKLKFIFEERIIMVKGEEDYAIYKETAVPYCAHPNLISSGHACASLSNAAWECPPSRGRATDAREKELQLVILRP
ncbi:hypothetical protein CRG98_005345, partial [Punica granatum]